MQIAAFMKIGILYAESEFTPWKENINLLTVTKLANAFDKENTVSVIHMTMPNEEMALLLQNFDVLMNLCYGFNNLSQADIASWLDQNKISHLSSSGVIQQICQDKLAVEKILQQVGLFVPKTLKSAQETNHPHYISKPRFGGCHRGIEILPAQQIAANWNRWEFENKIVQPYLEGREFSVGIIPNKNGDHYECLPPLEIIPYPKREIYIAGISKGKTRRHFFPNLSSAESNLICNAAIHAHNTLHLEYMSRIDIRLIDKKAIILDVNAMPNLHPTLSMIPALLKAHRISLKDFLNRMLILYELKKNSK